MIRIHSTRLFPKKLGADRYEITGIASKCDWVVLSDHAEPNVHIHKSVNTDHPKSIFLSLRAHEFALDVFANDVLPRLRSPFVLVSGSEDITVPNQTDQRFDAFNQNQKNCIQAILSHPHLRVWAAENLDTDEHPKMIPLPVGMVHSNAPKSRKYSAIPLSTRLSSRPLRIFCANRVRKGAQWELRKTVTKLAKTHWSEFCTVIEEDLPEEEFLSHVGRHSFVLCPEGGGLDPSPKAWQAILLGAVPIISKNALYNSYRQLPVVFIDEWTPECITATKLKSWRDELIPFYDSAEKRAEVLRRLSLDYWWHQIIGLAID